jgi:hypothetical protein
VGEKSSLKTRDVKEAKLGNDEEETVYIDNLPETEAEIRTNLKEVRKHIKILEA